VDPPEREKYLKLRGARGEETREKSESKHTRRRVMRKPRRGMTVFEGEGRMEKIPGVKKNGSESRNSRSIAQIPSGLQTTSAQREVCVQKWSTGKSFLLVKKRISNVSGKKTNQQNRGGVEVNGTAGHQQERPELEPEYQEPPEKKQLGTLERGNRGLPHGGKKA